MIVSFHKDSVVVEVQGNGPDRAMFRGFEVAVGQVTAPVHIAIVDIDDLVPEKIHRIIELRMGWSNVHVARCPEEELRMGCDDLGNPPVGLSNKICRLCASVAAHQGSFQGRMKKNDRRATLVNQALRQPEHSV